MESLNTRQELLLKALVESFISDGQPVGSTKLSQTYDFGVSSATIRNVFVDLEDFFDLVVVYFVVWYELVFWLILMKIFSY